MDVSQFDWLSGSFEPFLMRGAGGGAPAGATAPESGVSSHAGSPIVAAGASGPDVTHRRAPFYDKRWDLDDEERYGELPERIDPQTGFVEES